MEIMLAQTNWYMIEVMGVKTNLPKNNPHEKLGTPKLEKVLI